MKQPKYDKQRVKASLERIFEVQEQEEAIKQKDDRALNPTDVGKVLPPLKTNQEKEARHSNS